MNVKRMCYTSSVAVGIGLAGLLGTGVASADAAPGHAPVATDKGAPVQPGTNDIKLDHHDRKQVLKQDKKELKHHPAQVTPTSGRG